jgi:hypothetical protein
MERCSLEYQYAFDLCAVQAHSQGGDTVLLVSSPFHALELGKRLDDSRTWLVPTWPGDSLLAEIQVSLGPEARHVHVQTLECLNVRPKAIVWAEPQRQNCEQFLDTIRQTLSPSCSLYVIVSGGLARSLPEWQQSQNHPGDRPAGLRWTLRCLHRGGYIVESFYGFHGPSSILWSYASRLWSAMGRDDLADRCLFRMRATYVASAWHALLAPVGMGVMKPCVTTGR